MAFNSKSGNGVNPAGMKRVAAGKPFQGQPATAQSPVFLHSFLRVFGTTRIKTTIAAQQGTDRIAVSAQQEK
jgi:hypothetical protein